MASQQEAASLPASLQSKGQGVKKEFIKARMTTDTPVAACGTFCTLEGLRPTLLRLSGGGIINVWI